jgi:dihydrofolate reductase
VERLWTMSSQRANVSKSQQASPGVAVPKHRPNNDLVITGSGELIQTLMRHDLIDGYMLIVHPLVLGTGRRQFPDAGASSSLRLTVTKSTGTGALIVVYEPRS